MKYINVQFIKAHPDFSYFAGDKGTVAEDRLKELSDGGFVQVFPGEPNNDDENPLPVEMPGRDILHENGYTLEKLEGITTETLESIHGIGKATATQILEFLAK